jgi:hypothetical protein
MFCVYSTHLSKEDTSIDSTLTGLRGRLGKCLIRTVGERDERKQVRSRNAIKGDIGGKICYPTPSQVEGIIATLLPVFYFQQVGLRLFLEEEGFTSLHHSARETVPLVDDNEIVDPNADTLVCTAQGSRKIPQHVRGADETPPPERKRKREGERERERNRESSKRVCLALSACPLSLSLSLHQMVERVRGTW